MRFLMALGLGACLLGGVRAQSVLYTLNGTGAGDRFGSAVRSAGDVDADGYPDLIVGSPSAANGFGQAQVFSGPSGALIWTFTGGAAQDNFGVAVSGVGDVNGDASGDVIVGAPHDSSNGFWSGSARVYSGLTGALLFSFNGNTAGMGLGYAVSGAGDVDGDGFADLIVGAPKDGSNGLYSGSAFVFSGQTGSVIFTFHGNSAGDRFGQAVSGAGDIDQDGFADLLVGAPKDDNTGFNTGSVRAISGQSGATLFTVNGNVIQALFGSSLSGAGDVNGDGVPDLIVGAPLRGGAFIGAAGSAHVFSGVGGALLFNFNGNPGSFSGGGTGEGRFGASVSGAGDVNGDGFADLMVKAASTITQETVRVFSGLDGSLLFTFTGDGPGDGFGLAVSDLGDVDGDGIPELMVGAPGDDNNGSDSGSVRVFLGAPSSLQIQAPSLVGFGNSLTYTLTSGPTLSGGLYLFDVSLTGAAPGLLLPPPQGGVLPLNPPLLSFTFGSQLPGVFTDFIGHLDGAGQATPVFNIPNVPLLAGITIFAAGITVDLQGLPTVGLVGNGVQTTIMSLGPPPSVLGITPALGPLSGGAPVTISGTHLSPGALVTIGGAPASAIAVVTSQTITAISPQGILGPAVVAVINPDSQSGTLMAGYSYIPDLSISGVLGLVAAPGAPVAILGTGFMPGLTILAGGIPATPLTITESHVHLSMPAGVACNGALVVTNPSGQMASIPFNPSPVVSALVGTTGPAAGGGSLLILGNGFLSGTVVTVGGNPATILSVVQTSIAVSVPPGSVGPAAVVLTSPSGCQAICIAPGGCSYLYQ